MLEEGKTYTYEELKEIIKKAGDNTLKELSESMNKATENDNRSENKNNSLGSFVFELQNRIVISTMNDKLFKKDKENKEDK